MQNFFYITLIIIIFLFLVIYFNRNRLKRNEESIKKIVDIALPVVTMVAIIIGGVWTYATFIREQTTYPEIQETVSHLAITDHVNLLRVGIKLTNTGKTSLLLNDGNIRIQQVKPFLECSGEQCISKEINDALRTVKQKNAHFSWPQIFKQIVTTSIDIQPGETDYIDFEFVIPSDVEVIRVYSSLRHKDEGKKDDGKKVWGNSVIYDFKSGKILL